MTGVPRDERLVARVLRTTPLCYAGGADPARDRPAHVRAGSGICRVADRLVVIQDDAAFLALPDPRTGVCDAVTLPAGADGIRQWDDARGNKHLKPDLEACLGLPDGTLLAFGSGSTPMRERVLVVRGLAGRAAQAEWIPCPALYAGLREATAFSGSEMNVEGAALVGGAVRLFNRGNGAPGRALTPVDASCDLPLGALRAYLEDTRSAAPRPVNVVGYDLGRLEGGRLGFTDAASDGGIVLFCAAAEASPDTYRDGPVIGSVVGFLAPAGGGWAPLLGPGEVLFPGKVEGITPVRGNRDRLYAVVDPDDPARPAELCEVALSGPWPANLTSRD